ncbi:DUF6879 family protein [Streptomyces collinus]|uniref:DUF6879 family protein n=1 Tax=Streptomyces collinus TaxID=42684 RepID=UPI003638C4FF
MARRLRFTGTDSKNGSCPALHEDTSSGEIIVQGAPLTDPEDVAQLQHLGPGDAAVVVPRELLVHHAPTRTERVRKLISPEEFEQLFYSFSYSAWHLETRRGYASDREDLGFEEFLQTGRAPMDLDSDWCTNICAQTDSGKYIGRVRVVDDPPTEGQLFLLSYARCNATTGEDARNMWRKDAVSAHILDEDFWIFDSRLVVVLHFDDQDVLGDLELITEPAAVLGYCQTRDAALHVSQPYDQFAVQLRRR